MEPTTPILVGVAACQQKNTDFARALEPLGLMEQSLRSAADDAGFPQLLSMADEILVPKGIWGYSDPARLLAQRLGATEAFTVLAEIGVSQQTLLTRACQRIAGGDARVVLVTGGEAKYRALCASKAGTEAAETVQTGVKPDLTLLPEQEIWSPVESAAGLGMPVGYYAIMDSALRYAQGLSVDEHRDQMAQMYARFSAIAAANPDAWSDEPVSAETIRDASAGNRMLAFPYTKLHNSQWNVDQGAGLILCSAELAESLGIPRERWVFPRAFAEANLMSVVASRGELGACPGFRLAGQAAAGRAGVSLAEIRLRELYSCFPLAVRSQLHEFGLDGGGDLSVTGGMTFGGGPLNNFVYQATVRMAQLLRTQPTELGLVTTVSGMLTKQGVALWSCTPGDQPWGFDDVTESVRTVADLRELVADYDGEAAVAGYTVLYQGSDPWRAVAVFDLPDQRRTVAYSEAAAELMRFQGEEACGLHCRLAGGQFHLLSP
jgi:acetyl-CoA C-acetyltransferase